MSHIEVDIDVLTTIGRPHERAGNHMGIGSGIFLFVVGAILAFALNVETSFVNLDLVGYILMGAGVVIFLISLAFMLKKRSSVEVTRNVDGGVQRETRRDSDPLI
ncbi:DUF6458 family protein [Marisediminicola sp. LYQ134]|uniref:DUF6458 family protein n=1 Tax=unclassified Marisediminicola TaxID=2618316 RepID=UPI003983CD2B